MKRAPLSLLGVCLLAGCAGEGLALRDALPVALHSELSEVDLDRRYEPPPAEAGQQKRMVPVGSTEQGVVSATTARSGATRDGVEVTVEVELAQPEARAWVALFAEPPSLKPDAEQRALRTAKLLPARTPLHYQARLTAPGDQVPWTDGRFGTTAVLYPVLIVLDREHRVHVATLETTTIVPRSKAAGWRRTAPR